MASPRASRAQLGLAEKGTDADNLIPDMIKELPTYLSLAAMTPSGLVFRPRGHL